MPGLPEVISIGGREFKPPLILAPMSGVTNSAFRRLVKRENPGAVGLVVTEFISVEGLTRANARSLGMMKFYPEESPIAIQIFGYDIERMAEAARIAEQAGADIVDINSGCPVPKVVKRGGGCELMRQPQHLEQMLTAVRRAIKVPLTLKFRSGWDEKNKNAVEIAKIAEGCGVSAVTVHGRTRVQLYRGDADWGVVRSVKDAVKIPVIGSGDIVDVSSANERIAAGVDAVMIGRGALIDPWIFSRIQKGDSLDCHKEPAEIIRVIRTYRELLSEEMPDKGVIGKLKQISTQITKGIPGGAAVRKLLCHASTVQEFSSVLDRWEDSLGHSAELLSGYA